MSSRRRSTRAVPGHVGVTPARPGRRYRQRVGGHLTLAAMSIANAKRAGSYLKADGSRRAATPPHSACIQCMHGKWPEGSQSMSTVKTSESDPIRIAAVTSGRDHGRIGVTLCPGKTDSAGISGAWKRDLDTDLDAIQRWGATAVITLIEEHEFDLLKVRDLPTKVRDRHMEWWHLPIQDGKSPPARGFEDRWGGCGGGSPGPTAAGLRRARPLPWRSGTRRNRCRPPARGAGRAPGPGDS